MLKQNIVYLFALTLTNGAATQSSASSDAQVLQELLTIM
jgi:hypothetical protein